ncbi:MAG TPA: heavy-metal-associated domain-containing protein [Chromatiales bacterium]|nr:heavy-metal-associated domain-containing protein [Chromatiales bacterium]
MTITRIEVDNIKCGGCMKTIENGLLRLDGVTRVDIDLEAGAVSIEATNLSRDALAAVLSGMGYPEHNSVSGIGSAAAKAKSFINGAIGKLS